MPQLIVFDWDGTLADSVSKIVECKHFLASKYDLPQPSEAQIRNVLGTPFQEAMAECFPSSSRIQLKNMGEEFHELMQKDQYQAELFPNAKNVLRELKQQTKKLAVATFKNRKELDKAIIQNGLSELFDLTCCGGEYKEKPDPAMLNHMMATFNIPPDKCLMIGDTVADLLFAQNAGVKAIGVTFGAHPIAKLQSMNPYVLIDDLSQLPQIIDKLATDRSFIS